MRTASPKLVDFSKDGEIGQIIDKNSQIYMDINTLPQNGNPRIKKVIRIAKRSLNN